MSEPKWVKLTTYAEMYDVDARTVRKWAEAGLIVMTSVKPSKARRIIWVKNQPPWSERPKSTTSHM